MPDASHDSLQRRAAEASDPEALREAIEHAFDYRGDVTITRKSSPHAVEGYVFDRRADRATGEVTVRVMVRDSEQRMTIPLSDIQRLEFTGRDAASGKSFETWVKKYVEKKIAGERANIESEPIE
jgi:hypothetical protein